MLGMPLQHRQAHRRAVLLLLLLPVPSVHPHGQTTKQTDSQPQPSGSSTEPWLRAQAGCSGSLSSCALRCLQQRHAPPPQGHTQAPPQAARTARRGDDGHPTRHTARGEQGTSSTKEGKSVWFFFCVLSRAVCPSWARGVSVRCGRCCPFRGRGGCDCPAPATSRQTRHSHTHTADGQGEHIRAAVASPPCCLRPPASALPFPSPPLPSSPLLSSPSGTDWGSAAHTQHKHTDSEHDNTLARMRRWRT
jgi:hypothetical protein